MLLFVLEQVGNPIDLHGARVAIGTEAGDFSQRWRAGKEYPGGEPGRRVL